MTRKIDGTRDVPVTIPIPGIDWNWSELVGIDFEKIGTELLIYINMYKISNSTPTNSSQFQESELMHP